MLLASFVYIVHPDIPLYYCIENEMKIPNMNDKIYIAKSKIKEAGRGVFASADIKKNETIEAAPVIIFDHDDDGQVAKTILQHYVFEYTKNSSLLALGFGSLYNHSLTPNAKYEIEENELGNVLYFIATRKILKGEEIYINYGPFYDEMYNGA